MATRVQFRRGNTSQTATFTGAVGEITVDIDKKVVVVHDGITAGGNPAPTITFVQDAYDHSNAAYDLANSLVAGAGVDSFARTWANSAGSYANSAFSVANNALTISTGGFIQANSAFDEANAAYILAQGAFNSANNVAPQVQPAFNTANAAFIQANSAFDKANSAYTQRLQWDGGSTNLVASTGRTSLGVTATGSDTTYAYRANNLSDLASASTARTNLGLGTAATMAGPSGTIVGTTDVQTMTNKTFSGYTETVVTASTSTAYTINISSGTVQILTLTGNCTYTFPTATAGQSFLLYQLQDATGSRTVTWPAAVKWPSGTAPTLTSTASKADIFGFTADGTNWIGRTIGQAYL